MYVNAYGLNVVFDRYGQGPLVLLLAESAEHWQDVFPLPTNYCFVLPDLPGHGRTEGPAMAPEELAEYVVVLITLLNLGVPKIAARGLGVAVARVLQDRWNTQINQVDSASGLVNWLEETLC